MTFCRVTEHFICSPLELSRFRYASIDNKYHNVTWTEESDTMLNQASVVYLSSSLILITWYYTCFLYLSNFNLNLRLIPVPQQWSKRYLWIKKWVPRTPRLRKLSLHESSEWFIHCLGMLNFQSRWQLLWYNAFYSRFRHNASVPWRILS